MKALVLVAMFGGATLNQTAAPSVAGTWTAQFEGRTYVRLELSGANGAVRGGITLGNVEFEPSGSLRRVEVAPAGLKPISDVRQRESIMTFSVAGGDEPDRFEFKLIDPSHAELRLLISDELRKE